MSGQSPTPSWRDKMRPVELLVMAAVFGVFVGAFVFMGTREWGLALIMAAVAFIASLVILATLLIAVGPKIGGDERVDPVDPAAPSGSAGSVHRDPRTDPHGH
ncbi:ABC transporter ATP-binding protein [Protaetiibacter mangrovi]|uniref:ABC transporter ATP-binding protein n=1 Tax=Protaetiibacter mangrovi TaxID=2970926 RepID=A0ABT1ZH67_9MICO|nr:ABC transporter ATP-binding protein [Protaetiibacter mangrovi]MCS0500053.1 ABC transporter ATP-binding protein [Protaetiibacter mangrovi]TPX03158.1 ABC transporter ATP-binding protein [Schumannella luteola]